jgi:predicted GNAT superfamily acetyltransferase
MAPPVTIRRARPDDLPAAAALLRRSLRFTAADAVPAWLRRTTDDCGGLTLVAAADGSVVGVSYAFAGCADGTTFLFSCGLAVASEYRGRRLGLQLKLAQRREAIALGYSAIRWTTDPVNGRALRLYLSGLGALVTACHSGLHDGLRADPGHPQDDLEVVWDLAGEPRVDRMDLRFVDVPWSSPDASDRDRVREEMSALLSDGFVGSAVQLDPSARRCQVAFARTLA